MAKVSKYKQLIGKVINDVMVIDYERQERVSKKSGKTYKVTRLYVTADGENMLEIGTASFNKMSFLKRLAKITTKWIYKEPVKSVSEPAMYYPAVKPMAEFKPASEIVNSLKDFKAIYDLKELKKTYRQLSKKHHPDCGGNAQTFKEMHMNYKKRQYAIKSTTELFEECPEFAEFTTFEEEVDDAMINTNWDGVFEKGEF